MKSSVRGVTRRRATGFCVTLTSWETRGNAPSRVAV